MLEGVYMKSAKEMFEELGYRYLYLAGDIIYTNVTSRIVFRNMYKDISLDNIDLLQPLIIKAINKQVEELGWLDGELIC